MDSLSKYVAKPATCGIIAYAASAYMHPNATLLVSAMGGKAVSLPLATAAFVAIVSIVADLTHDVVLSHIPITEGKLKEPVAASVAVATNTAAVSAALYLSNPAALQELGFGEIVVESAISELGGDWIWRHYIDPLIR